MEEVVTGKTIRRQKIMESLTQLVDDVRGIKILLRQMQERLAAQDEEKAK